MITYENLPPSAQKAYNRINRLRKLSVFVNWFLFIIFFFALSNYIDPDLAFVPIVIIFSLFFGCMLHGMVHFGFFLKKTFSSSILIGILTFSLLLVVAQFTGGVHLIIDTVRLVKKRPLLRDSEMHHLLNTTQSVIEMETEYHNARMSALTPSTPTDKAVNDLQKLKKLYEQGVITEEEFNKKKAELLDLI